MLFHLGTQYTLLIYVTCILLIVALFALSYIFKKKLGSFPYIAKESLLSKTELNFYIQLVQVLEGTGYTVLIKVGLQDIIHVPRSTENYIIWKNKINQKHIDFLLCDSNFKPIRAIELDDKTHNLPNRIERDAFVDEVFKTVEIPIEHIVVSSKYNLEHLKNIDKNIHPNNL